MNKSTLLACSKCKGKVPLYDLKADKEGKSWICNSCYALQHPGLRIQEKNINFKETRVNKIRTNSNNKKFKYQCSVCKFKFSRNSEYMGVCPYCSKESSLQIINEDLEI